MGVRWIEFGYVTREWVRLLLLLKGTTAVVVMSWVDAMRHEP
jgi:hypothetical protein